MRRRKGFTLIELLVVIAIIAVLAAILFPVFARARKAAQNSTCQSNMSQIGRALKMYLSEWHDTYPTNRNTSGLNYTVKLTPAGLTDGTGAQLRFVYGVNWVEALYPYVEAVTKDQASAWLCPAASNKGEWATGPWYDTSYVSYTFNYNMIEQPEGVIKAASNLMISREMDRKVNSVLRPANMSTDSQTPPQTTFLGTTDTYVRNNTTTNPYQHSAGSNVLFADSHVKSFSTDMMPKDCVWDSVDSQWYNFVGTGDVKKDKSIAVSP
jgi:prepilin-type N-terminal cleavage/methylation domain-containing protein/prepilin-type processing-associated H-X9-DG protein